MIDQGILEKTLEFAPGEWLLSSYIATGIENVPIFIRADNAENELEKFFANCWSWFMWMVKPLEPEVRLVEIWLNSRNYLTMTNIRIEGGKEIDILGAQIDGGELKRKSQV